MRIALTLLCLLAPSELLAQQPVTRAAAVTAALIRGARAALGRADTAAAWGVARTARAFPNPTVSGTYSKDTPNYHALGDLPLDLPWLRAPRIGAAESARDAARYRFAFERAAIRFDVDTTYTRGLAAALHARLSRRTALDADSLLRIAELRRDVGDVSELDVRLAAVNAGQLENIAVDDSFAALSTLLALQLQMGLSGDEPMITLIDSLVPPAPLDSEAAGGHRLLPVAAAEASLRSAERSLAFARRSRFAPSLQLGFDTGDPTSPTPHQLLPVVGFSLPLPLFNWSGGEVMRAAAERDRARAQLDLTRRETDAAVARAQRNLAAARTRLRRAAGLVESANRIAAMSLRAYSEGAVALASVLEAQRNARDILARYIDDLAAADAAARALRLLTAGPDEP
ncbi:MAG TPA: TolC family protein [Gemmatimonadales bacterium]|nr:TolC family protein [Gemmatimonadales bacterium]